MWIEKVTMDKRLDERTFFLRVPSVEDFFSSFQFLEFVIGVVFEKDFPYFNWVGGTMVGADG